ncbi:hypothetical protein IW261DRAFT_1571542 [Armillaria novae-zelandiae]|uniref:DUF6534 domain-containing protein n=1 Tax=Armillaria novae-zelandiae TaxID=153914 RepID=A0AA39U0U8_9AGAR|nr:hypothetical protein IW261DRAFT_1571542 [Armillaria novae-zelandiae]
MNSLSSTAAPSIGETLGALYIGSIIAAMLFGITNLQSVMYYKRYPKDWWLYRCSVALLWVLDTLHVILSTHTLYFYLIEMFGDLSGALVHDVCSAFFILNLMRLVLVSGLATSTCSLLTLISYIAWPESLIFLGIVFILPKLYINSLLAMFNHRPKRQTQKPNTGHNGHSTSESAILQFAPHNTAEMDINTSPSEIQETGSFSHKLDHSKENPGLEV